MTESASGETSAARRLTVDIGLPSHREMFSQCLTGTMAPAATLMHLLAETRDPAVVRAMVDEITSRAASLSRATDSLLRDRVDELTQLVVDDIWHENLGQQTESGTI